MTTSCKHTVQFEDEGQSGSFGMKFTTTGGVDPSGDSDHPSRLSFYIEQLDGIDVNERNHTVSIRFHGSWEFADFHRSLARLTRELNAAYGDPLEVVS